MPDISEIPDAPDAPVWYDAHEHHAWQSGWQAGYERANEAFAAFHEGLERLRPLLEAYRNALSRAAASSEIAADYLSAELPEGDEELAYWNGSRADSDDEDDS